LLASDLALAGAATLRLLAQPKKGEERSFHQILCSFLWAYVVFAGIYNHVSAVTEGHSLDLLVDVPFLVLAAATIFPLAQRQEPTQWVPKKPLALFINNSSPIFYTLALSALGLAIVRPHFYIGIIPIILALVVYGIRVITLQGRYMQSQQALQLARDRLEEISLRDGLTNVANRRRFDQTLASEWNRAVRMQHPKSLLLIDIDYFKTLNDRYGHPSGDQCLIAVAAAMQSVLTRSGDLLARYGGEEFAVILPATGGSGAELVASTMRAVRSLRIKNETSMGDFTTVSIGTTVEEFPQTWSPASLIEAADRALYKAKLNGRDRIEHS
jgi:diguanylate cyclase (GGDEF)-like protein